MLSCSPDLPLFAVALCYCLIKLKRHKNNLKKDHQIDMDSHKLRIHWKAKDGRDKSEPGMVETPPPALWWLMLIPLAANWHLWGNPPTSTPPSIIVLTPGLSPFPSLTYTHTCSMYTPKKWIDLIQTWEGGYIKGLALSSADCEKAGGQWELCPTLACSVGNRVDLRQGL